MQYHFHTLHKFQSTPSLRKVTHFKSHALFLLFISIHTFLAEGDSFLTDYYTSWGISIHTFLAEGDDIIALKIPPILISIHTFLAEGDKVITELLTIVKISIHTFLAEGDYKAMGGYASWTNFNPHLPCGR